MKRRDWISLVLLFLSFFSLWEGSAAAEEWEASDYGWFLTGGVSAFLLHESAHAIVAKSFGFGVRVESRQKPIPFVVVKYDLMVVRDESGRLKYLDKEGRPVEEGADKRFAIASAGINSQNITSEWILTRYPRLRDEPRPFLKGMLAFDIITSAGYAVVGRKDPDGDLRGMAESLGVKDRWVGALVFLPAAVDAYRYFYPEARWAPWVSRGAKGYLLGLALRW